MDALNREWMHSHQWIWALIRISSRKIPKNHTPQTSQQGLARRLRAESARRHLDWAKEDD